MASSIPFNQLTGTLVLYLAPVGESVPDVDTTPAGNWVDLGNTDGDQVINHAGPLTKFYTNEQQGPVKGVRPQEDPVITLTLVDLTLENYARVLDQASDVVTDAGPPATKKIPLKRGATPNEYALLFKGLAASPYGAFPAMYVVPRCSFDDEPSPTFAKDGRPALEVQIAIWEDETVAAADSLGWLIAQTA